jgi:hypothetical protein
MFMKCLRSAMIIYISRDYSCLHQTRYKLRSTICLSNPFSILDFLFPDPFFKSNLAVLILIQLTLR